jgi:hypothetical protein
MSVRCPLLRQTRKLAALRVVGAMLGVGAIHDSSLFDLIG